MSTELWRLDATDIAHGIRTGEFTSRDAVTACLERIDKVNPALNAIVEARPEEALAAADTADKAVAAGEELGLLHGVPVTIKGCHDLGGWATVNGCAALKDNIAAESSPCVRNWQDAGVVVLGRTNTPEFSCRWETTNDFYGATSNPWNSERTPGGSSGGAAASVAAGMNPLSTGTDLGGSLRQPAQACGVASMRPGRGRVPDYNFTDPAEPGIGFQLMNVNGHLARSVRDLELGLRAMAPGDWHDPWWAGVPLNGSPIEPHPISLVLDPGGSEMTAQVRDGVERAGRILADAGYDVEEINPPDIAEAFDIWQKVCLGELVTLLEPAVKDIIGPTLQKTFDCYRQLIPGLNAEMILEALARRRGVLRAWMGFFEKYPLVVAPVGTEPPNTRDEDISNPERNTEVMNSFRMTVVVNALGLPSVTVPVGIGEGMPQAVQVIGPPFAEMCCLAAARAIEADAGAITPIDPR
ncbi:MAG: amidase [Gammaproteobacteria bacterium]|nr:amidase [Gammaproteobacteria bacterium]